MVPIKRIVGAKMAEKPNATFDIFYIPPSPMNDLQGALKSCTWTVPGGHAEAVILCDAIDCLVHGLPPASTSVAHEFCLELCSLCWATTNSSLVNFDSLTKLNAILGL